MALSLIDCSVEHVPALRALFTAAYGPKYVLLTNEALFDWQFQRCPAGSGYAITLAMMDAQVVGCLGCMPIQVSVAGSLKQGAWVVNWLVDPEQRQLGVGPLLMRDAMKRFDVLLNVGANEVARSLLVRMGWADRGPLPRFLQVLDRNQAARLAPGGRLDLTVAQSRAPVVDEGSTSVERVPAFDRAVNDVWDATWGQSDRAGARRSDAFLNWRYAQHPVFSYRLFEARRAQRVVAVAVYRVEQVRAMDVRVGRIVEFIAQPGVEDALLQSVSDDARSQGCAFVDMFCSDAALDDVMARHDFVTGDRLLSAELPIVFQPVDTRRRTGPLFLMFGAEAGQPLNWYATSGDADQDRPN